MTQSPVQLDLGSATMNCTAEEIAATLASLLNEMRLVIPRPREDERDLLRQIMSRDSGTLRVADVFPDFARESEGHKTLRRLRAEFVRPNGPAAGTRTSRSRSSRCAAHVGSHR